MANEFDNASSDLDVGPKKPQLINYQNVYDALKDNDILMNRSGVFLPDGGFAKTPDDLKNLLRDEKSVSSFFNYYKDSPKFKTFGVSDPKTLSSKLNESAKGFAWSPSVNKVDKIETYGLDKLDPSTSSDDSENEKNLIFSKLAVSGINVDLNGKQLGTTAEFENFTYQPEAFEKWVSENKEKAMAAGVNPYSVKDAFQATKKTGDLDSEKQSFNVDVANSELTNSIVANYGVNEEEIGQIIDQTFSNPSYAMDISKRGKSFYNDETGQTQDLKNITMSDLMADAQDRGLSEEEAFSYLNSFRGQYLDKQARAVDYQNNMSAKTVKGAPVTLGSNNAYQIGMDKKGFDMLDENFKQISKEYSKLDELTKISQTLKKEGTFKQSGRNAEVEQQIINQKNIISKLQKEADISTAVIYDPVQRVPVDAQVASLAISKAKTKYNEEYYDRTLFGEMKKQRNILMNQVEDLKNKVLADADRLSKRAELGLMGPENQNAQLALQSNQQLYVEKTAELIALNKGIYTNSNPLKRETQSIVESASTVFNRDYLGGTDFYSKITPADEAYQLSKFMQNKGFYVSEKDLLKTKDTVAEMVGAGIPSTLQAMLEIGAYEAIGNYGGGVIAASKYFTAAKEFFKLKHGKAGVKLFEIFVEGGMQLAIKEAAYIGAGQSAAGAAGEIYAEKGFDAIALNNRFKKLVAGKSRIAYQLGRYSSGVAGETTAEVAGGIADLMTEYGYDFRKSFDITTKDGQFQAILVSSAILTAPGDIKTAFKTQQKFREELVSRGGEDFNPLTMEYSRLLDQVIEQTSAEAPVTQEEDMQPVEPDLPEGTVEMSDAPIEEPAVSEQIPQEKANEVKNKEKLEVEKRKADLGEEFHRVEKDGTIDKSVTYKYDEKTGNLQSKGYSRFNSSFEDVNTELKDQVESEVAQDGMLSKSKGLEIAKEILGIDENSKLVFKDGKLFYSKDQLQKNASENIKNVKSSAKNQVKKLNEKAKSIKEKIFSDVEDAYTTSPTANAASANDASFNRFLQIYKSAFGGKLRTNLHSLFFDGVKFNPDARKGIPRISDYIAPMLDRFSNTNNVNFNIVNRVVSSVINSKYFKDSLGSDLAALETDGLTSDAAMTLVTDMLLDSHDDVLDNIFDGDELKIQEFKTMRDSLNDHIQKEYIGKQSNANSPAFYNNRMEEAVKKTTDAEMAMKAKDYKVVEEEKRQIQNTGKMARGEDYSAEEVNAIRYSQGKMGALDFLNSLNENTKGRTEEEIKEIADIIANNLNVYENFKGYQEKLGEFKKTRKARIAKIKKSGLEKNFDFEVYGSGSTKPGDNIFAIIGAAIKKPLKLSKQKNYAANLMNTMVEFAALRAGISADDFLDTKLHFDRITREQLAALEGQMLYSKDGELEVLKAMQDNADLVEGTAEKNLLNANAFLEAGIDPSVVYHATGWYKSVTGSYVYKYGNPERIQPKEALDLEAAKKSQLSDNLGNLITLPESLLKDFPELSDFKLRIVSSTISGVNLVSVNNNEVRILIDDTKINSETIQARVEEAIKKIVIEKYNLQNIQAVKSKSVIESEVLNLDIEKIKNLDGFSELVKYLNEIIIEGDNVEGSLFVALYEQDISFLPVDSPLRFLQAVLKKDPAAKAIVASLMQKTRIIDSYFEIFEYNLNFQSNPLEFIQNNTIVSLLQHLKATDNISEIKSENEKSRLLLKEMQKTLLSDLDSQELLKLRPLVEKFRLLFNLNDRRLRFLDDHVYSNVLLNDTITTRSAISGFLQAFSNDTTLSAVQKQKILNFSDEVRLSYDMGSMDLVNLGIGNLKQELNNPNFDKLFAELMALDIQASEKTVEVFRKFVEFNTSFSGEILLALDDSNTNSVFLNRVKQLKNKKLNDVENDNVRKTTIDKINKLYGQDLLDKKTESINEFQDIYEKIRNGGDEFIKEFLGDSVTIDENGNPMIFYRGSNVVYGKESEEKQMFYTTRLSKASSYMAPSTSFAAVKLDTGGGSNIRSSFIKMENPVVIDAQGQNWTSIIINNNYFSTNDIHEIVRTYSVIEPADDLFQMFKFDDFLKDSSKKPDGIIFKNLVDYGESTVSDKQTPGDVYVPLYAENVLLRDITLFQNDGTIRAAVNINKHGQSIIYAVTNPNVSSPLHEMAHVLEDYLSESEKQAVLEFAGETEWNVNTSETFARGFEKFLMDGVSPTREMQTVFEKFKAWLTEIYTALGLENLGKDLNPEMRSIYNTIFGVSEPAEKQESKVEDELYDFIESQREQRISDDQIYKGLIEAGYKAEDVSEYFTLRTKQTILSQMANKGEFSEAARAIANDTVTVQRTFTEILQELSKLDQFEIDAVLANLENMQDLDKALVAKILLMRKMRGDGKDISQELSEIAEIGTNAGRILQRMKLLKKEMEDQTLATVLKQLNDRNMTIPPKALERLKKLSAAVTDIRAKYEAAKDVAARYPMEVSATNPRMNNYENALDLRQQYQDLRFMFVKELRGYSRSISASDLYQTLVRGNLLTIGSMVINMTSNAAKTIVNIPINFLATGFGAVKHKFFGSELVTHRGVDYYKKVTGSYGKAWQEMTKTLAMGAMVEDANGLQINSGFNGFRALRDSFGMLVGAIDGSNSSLSDEQFAEKYKLPLDKNGNVIKKAVLLRVAEGVFGASAEFNFRALGGPDAFFKTTAYWGALYEQGRTLGLSDVKEAKLGGRSKLEMFMELNADYSNEPAMAEALKLIYANDGMLYKGLQTLFGTKVGGNKITKSLITTQIPFQKIPSNVAQEFFMFAVPELGLVSSAWKQFYQIKEIDKELQNSKIPSQKKKLRDERRKLQRESEIDLARTVVAYGLHFAANQIIQQFAISGSSAPAAGVDDKERRWKEEFKPADYINLTLMLENAQKEPGKKRKDWLSTDKKIQLRDLGMFGAILSIKQTGIEKYNRGNKVIDLSNVHTQYEDNLGTDLSNAVPYLLDQTMLKGIGDAVNVLFETEADAFASFASGFVNTIVTAVAPNHLNQITKVFREFDADYRSTPEDKELGFQANFTKTLTNKLKEKVPFVFDDDYVVRYDVTGKPRRQKGKDIDPILDFFGVLPQRREVGINHTIDEIAKIVSGDKKPEWKDLIYIGFVYGDSKSVIPPDLPKSIEASGNLGIKKSLSQEEKDRFREELNPIREGLVNKVIKGVNFKKLLDINSSYNQRADGSKITFGDKNLLLGYYVLSEILNETYTKSQGSIETLLGPSIINNALQNLSAEQKSIINKITSQNITGEVFKKVEENTELTSMLQREGLKISELFKNELLDDAEIEEPEVERKRPKVIINGIEYLKSK